MTLSDNQLLYSQLLSNAAWVATTMTLTSGQTDPSAGTDAFTLTATAGNATLLQSVALTDTLQRTFSIYLKRKTGTGNISITVDGATYSVETTTGSWARFDTTLTASGTVTAGVKITTSGDEVYRNLRHRIAVCGSLGVGRGSITVLQHGPCRINLVAAGGYLHASGYGSRCG